MTTQDSRKTRKVVIDYDALRTICQAEWDYFKQFGTEYNAGTEERFIFNDTGSKVLFVAHLDSVMKDREHFNRIGTEEGRVIVQSPVLDDRLGAYSGLVLLPEHLGENCFSILLTDNEEINGSTAEHWMKSIGKDYIGKFNWVVEVDRMGANDCAMYAHVDNKENRELVKLYGWQPTHGSFTDICNLYPLGVLGMNISCGYENYHAKGAWMDVRSYVKNMARLMWFFEENKDIKIESSVREKVVRYYGGYSEDDFGRWQGAYTNLNDRGTSGTSTAKRNYSIVPHTDVPLPAMWSRPADFSWVLQKDAIKQKVTVDKDSFYILYINSDLLAAFECAGCHNIHWFEQGIILADGLPYCMSCALNGQTLSKADLQYVQEGGVLVVNFENGVRSTYRSDTLLTPEPTYMCSGCNGKEFERYKDSYGGLCGNCIEGLIAEQELVVENPHDVPPLELLEESVDVFNAEYAEMTSTLSDVIISSNECKDCHKVTPIAELKRGYGRCKKCHLDYLFENEDTDI